MCKVSRLEISDQVANSCAYVPFGNFERISYKSASGATSFKSRRKSYSIYSKDDKKWARFSFRKWKIRRWDLVTFELDFLSKTYPYFYSRITSNVSNLRAVSCRKPIYSYHGRWRIKLVPPPTLPFPCTKPREEKLRADFNLSPCDVSSSTPIYASFLVIREDIRQWDDRLTWRDVRTKNQLKWMRQNLREFWSHFIFAIPAFFGLFHQDCAFSGGNLRMNLGVHIFFFHGKHMYGMYRYTESLHPSF